MKTFVRALTAALLLAAAAVPATAQHLGDVSITTITQTLFPAGTSCTGAAQTAIINNQGQTSHTIQFFPTGARIAQFYIEGSNDGTLFTRLSDETDTANITVLQASGYYTVLRVTIVCQDPGGGFRMQYSGSGVPPSQPAGDGLVAQVEKILVQASPANTNISGTYRLPYGNLAGVLIATATGAGWPGGSTFTITCSFAVGAVDPAPQVFSLTGTSVLTNVTAKPCVTANWNYVSGGASAQTFRVEHVISSGFSGAAGVGTNVQGTTPSGTVFTGNSVVVGGITSPNDTPALAAQSVTVLPETIAAVSATGMFGFAIGAGNINPNSTSGGVTWPNRGPMAVALSALKSELSTATTNPVHEAASNGAIGPASVGAADTSLNGLLNTNNGFMQVTSQTVTTTSVQTITTSARLYGTFDACFFTLSTGTPTGTTPTLDVTIQSSASGLAGTFIDRIHFNQVTTVAGTQKQAAAIAGSPGFNPTNLPATLAAGARLDGPIGAWLQISYTIGGTTPSFPSVQVGVVCH